MLCKGDLFKMTDKRHLIERENIRQSSSSVEELQRKIRKAEEPNNPALIADYLCLEGDCNADSVQQKRKRYLKQYNLLLDTIADECIPSHWRCTCLDHIYHPLLALKRLAKCNISKRQVRSLFYELNVTGQYLQPSLIV